MTVIVDYDAGNLRSVQRACSEIGVRAEITSDPSRIRDAERIIFPGVGQASTAMRSIQNSGIDQAILDAFGTGIPILGICIGLQISLNRSEEGDVETLGLIPGHVRRFRMQNSELKVPHMGWNDVQVAKSHPILDHVQTGDEFYFVHAYYPEPENEACVYARAEYESTFCCALGLRNFFGTQFHPEKSGRVGLELIRNFMSWDGTVA